jgi:hypothetical protein
MNKNDYYKLRRQGIIVLRAQYDQRKNCWKIVEYKLTGGWGRFGAGWYLTKEDCQAKITVLVNDHPNTYREDE